MILFLGQMQFSVLKNAQTIIAKSKIGRKIIKDWVNSYIKLIEFKP